MRDPAVDGMSAVQMLSLTPTSTPAKGPGSSPAAIWASRRRAWERRTWRMDRISDCGGGEGVREAREAREGARGLKCG